MKDYKFGPLPWDFDKLTASYWQDLIKTTELIKEHPGYSYQADLDALAFTFNLYKSSIKDFYSAMRSFKFAHGTTDLFHKRNTKYLEMLEFNIRKSLYLVSASIMSVVDHTRRMSIKCNNKWYEDTVKLFSGDERHRFIQDLRNCLSHVKSVKPNWNITYSFDTDVCTRIQFILDTDELYSYKNWHPLAIKFISNNRTGIDIGQTIREHIKEFVRFQNQFIILYANRTLGDRTEYQRYVIHLKSISSRSLWNVVLAQVAIPKKMNLYDHLDKYLTPEELLIVNQLPFRSTAQVDLIIDLIDEYNACDEKLRALAYIGFNAFTAIPIREAMDCQYAAAQDLK